MSLHSREVKDVNGLQLVKLHIITAQLNLLTTQETVKEVGSDSFKGVAYLLEGLKVAVV